MPSKVVDRDMGFDAYMKGLKELGGARVKVGVQGREAAQIRPGGISMVELATIHEFGAPVANIPQRSFVRATGDAHQNKYIRLQEGIVRRLGKRPQRVDVKRELFVLGEIVRADMIGLIRARIPPPLKPATIARKFGENVPLIDTGQLIASIRSVVVA